MEGTKSKSVIRPLLFFLLPSSVYSRYNGGMSDKILHSFQARRLVVQAFDELGATTSENELIRQARTLVQKFDAPLILAELLRRLDTPSSQLRGGLGHVAALLPPDATTPALREVAADRRRAPQERIAAALILERYLGEDLPAGVMSDLDESDDVAMQSLREAIEEAQQNRHILLEYVLQMRAMGTEVAFAVMEMLARLPPADQIELLRLIAQDRRPAVMHGALRQLESLGQSDAGEAAARALHILTFMLPGAGGDAARRALRKLSFTGVRYAPPAPKNWHALLSPADVMGNQYLWFVRRPRRAETGTIVSYQINPVSGLAYFFAGEAIPPAFLPGAPGEGRQMLLDTGSGEPVLMVQPPLDLARQLAHESLVRYQAIDNPPSLPAEIELYSDHLWQFAAPTPAPDLAAYLALPDEPAPLPAAYDPFTQAEELLRLPSFSPWFRQFHTLLSETGFSPPADAVANNATNEEALFTLAGQALTELSLFPGAQEMQVALAGALGRQALWLHLTGNQRDAERAFQLASFLPGRPLQQDPLLLTLLAGVLARIEEK